MVRRTDSNSSCQESNSCFLTVKLYEFRCELLQEKLFTILSLKEGYCFTLVGNIFIGSFHLRSYHYRDLVRF